MATDHPAKPYSLRAIVAVPCILAVVGSGFWLKSYRQHLKISTQNFAIEHETPNGWKSIPHGPTTLFLYENPKNHLQIRGSVNQMISDVNPTPELDTKGLADFYVDRTEHMKGWTVQKMNDVPAHNTSFSVIRRATGDRIVVDAYAVRGNTTLLVTLFGAHKNRKNVDADVPEFCNYLSTIGLQLKDMSNL